MSNTLALGFLLFGFPSSFVFPFPFACQSMGFGRGLECAPTDHVNIMDPNHELPDLREPTAITLLLTPLLQKLADYPLQSWS